MIRIMTPNLSYPTQYTNAFKQRLQELPGPGQLPAYLKTQQVTKLTGGDAFEPVEKVPVSESSPKLTTQLLIPTKQASQDAEQELLLGQVKKLYGPADYSNICIEC